VVGRSDFDCRGSRLWKQWRSLWGAFVDIVAEKAIGWIDEYSLFVLNL
jgi:hypothetical protein